MCGIAGFVSEAPLLSRAQLKSMGDALIHRGPDGEGLLLLNGLGSPCMEGETGVMGFAHRRLSIIDLSQAGAQPMSNEDGRLWLVFNGEIYNYRELRQELAVRGHVFRSNTDTEVILHLYEEVGIADALRKINGMFAFALWDGRSKSLYLARDRVGKKPLYYSELPDGRGLLFGSEMKALQAAGLSDLTIDPVALNQVWTVTTTIGARTIFKGIHRILPAHYAVWTEGLLRFQEYWDCVIGAGVESSRSQDDWADELDALLKDSVKRRLVADVPVGLFLSGGIDSSLVTAIAAQVAGKAIQTYTVGFEQKTHNEAEHAVAVAKHLDVENHVLMAPSTDWRFFQRMTRHFDEPFGDTSLVPTGLVSKAASSHVKVALTGDGGDELFAGYDSYRQALRIWGQGSLRAQFRRPLTWGESFWEWRLRRRGFPRALMSFEDKLGNRQRRRLYKPCLWVPPSKQMEICQRDLWLQRSSRTDVLSTLQYLAFHTWLPDAFLRKVDMMSMAHSLECRSPLLDYQIVEFAAKLPFEMKFDSNGRGKNLLRHLLARYMPRQLFERPKRGFDIPWATWCAGETGACLRARWLNWDNPWLENEAADWLFPDLHQGNSQLQWTAFSCMETLGCPE